MVGGNSASSSWWNCASPVSAISRMRAARSLPIPGISRSAAASSGGEVVGMVGDDIGAVAVGANLERIVALDLEQVGNLAQNPRDCDVIQREAPRARFGSPAPARRRRSARRRWPPAPTADRSRRGNRRRRHRRPLPQSRRPTWLGRSSVSMAGVVTPGARRLRLSHSVAMWRPTSSQSPRSSATRIAAAVSRMRSKQSKMCRSPSIWRLVISQLLVPEFRGSPV